MEKANDQTANNGVTQHEEMNGEQQEDVDLDEDAQATERLTDADPNKVKFTSIKMDGFGDKNGDARVDIRVAQASVGMGKEELMKYANEPYWVRLRMILFVMFWVSWVAMLVGAVAIIILAPRCPPPPQLEWHEKTTMYRLSVQSFKDSDDDGVGDFKGLISKLNYFKDINVGTLLLSAFYAMAPNSNGIVNHTSIDNRFGTMADFEDLVKEIKSQDMKLVIDFNPNHSSDEHPWFKASVKREEPYTDFYVWADKNKEGKIPSNWLSVNDESAWEWNDDRKQYYYHAFGKDQPEFNLRNSDVKEEMKKIMEFWLGKGVDGLKVTAASNLFEHSDFNRDEPLATATKKEKPNYKDLNHIYTLGQPENLELFSEWQELLKNASTSNHEHKVLLAEVSEPVNASVRYYGNASQPLADFPINVQLTHLTSMSTGLDLHEHIMKWLNAMPGDMWPNWQLGSELTDRLSTRVGPELIDGIHMVGMLTRGTPITYYGDELGMTYDPLEKIEFILNQSPMQWNSDHQAGFTGGNETYAPLNPSYQQVNVKMQFEEKLSHLSIFKSLLALRNKPAITLGVQEYPVVTEEIFSLLRVRKGSPGYLVVLNMGKNTTKTDFNGKSEYLPSSGHVELHSVNIKTGLLAGDKSSKVDFSAIELDPKQAVVLSFVPVFKN